MKMIDAIAAHRAVWQTFQDAAEGEAAEQAEDEEGYALEVVLTLLPAEIEEVRALKAHLDWYVVEERERFHHGEPQPTNISNIPFAVHAALAIALGEAADG